MPRPFTLFTGQWADLPLEEVCQHAREWGYAAGQVAVLAQRAADVEVIFQASFDAAFSSGRD